MARKVVQHLLSVGILVLLSPHVLAMERAADGLEEYETAYACEDTRLNITCGSGLHLNIIRANYGRFSIAICNAHGNTEWSVNCMSPRTLRVIKARCGGSSNCDVPVDSTIFGDPCPGTYKYVEVHYSCDQEMSTSTTSRPRPPWIPVSAGHPWTDIPKLPSSTKNPLPQNLNQTQDIEVPEITTLDPMDSEDYEDESLPDYKEPEIVTQRVIEVKVPKPLGNFGGNIPERRKPKIPIRLSTTIPEADNPVPPPLLESSTVVTMANFTRYCQPSNARGLYWNWTSAGDTAVLQCPNGSTGFAKWHCKSNPVEWATLSPSLGECQSMWLNNLDSRLRDGEAISTVSGDLAQLSGLQPMYGGDLTLSTRMLKHMAERMHYDIQGTQDITQRETMVTDLVQNIVMTGSNILSQMNHVSWADLGYDDVAAAATALMIGLEENAFLLADSVTTEKIIIKPTENILLSIRVMQSRNTNKQKFPTVETSGEFGNLEMWDNNEDSIELSSNSLLQNSENGAVRVIFTTYNEFEKLLIPNQRENTTGFVNSKVISASLGKGRHIELPEPVKITLKHLRTDNVSQPSCAFWDYVLHAWSTDGCHVVGTNRTHTQCECDHITNFALIMQEGEEPVAAGLTVLSSHITTIIACVATLLCVSLMVFGIIMTWRKFQVSHQCRSMLQNSGLPCFHKTKELSEKDKKQGNFYTVTPKLNSNINNETGKSNVPIEMDSQQYFEHMIAMQKNQDTLVLNKTGRRSTTQNNLNEQETALDETDMSKNSNVPEHNINNNASNAANTLNNKKNFKVKTQCQHVLPNGYPQGMHNEIIYPKKNNFSRAMSPYNHIYMEIEPADDGTVYEPLNQSEASRSETYMLSTVSDMSDEDYRRCSDVSRQSSSRYAEHKPLIRASNINMERNLLTTISGVLQSQSVRVAPQHHRRTSILSTISGMRYVDPSQPGQPSLPSFLDNGQQVVAMNSPEALQVTTVNGNQFVCLNLNQENGDSTYATSNDITATCYASMSDASNTYMAAGNADLNGVNTATYVTSPLPSQSTTSVTQPGIMQAPVHSQPGIIQAPVHSQFVIQRVGTLPRQYAHPLSQQ